MAILSSEFSSYIAKAQRAQASYMLEAARRESNGEDAMDLYLKTRYLSNAIRVLSFSDNGLTYAQIEQIIHCMIEIGEITYFSSAAIVFPSSTPVLVPIADVAIIDLTDGPGGSLVGQELKILQVKADGSGWEFVSVSSVMSSGQSINNTLFVDPSFGDASTALRERFDKKFATIAAAIAASTAGDTIVLMPGTFTENITVSKALKIVTAADDGLIYDPSGWINVPLGLVDTARSTYINGTVTVTANNVILIGFNCNTLAINHTGGLNRYKNIIAKTAITSNQASIAGSWYDVHSFEFLKGEYLIGGIFEKCIGYDYAFGGNDAGAGSSLQAKFTDCMGRNYSFGGSSAGNSGHISGVMMNCVADEYSFASSDVGDGGEINSSLINCSAGLRSFSSSMSGASGLLSGRFINCVAGDGSYASSRDLAGGSITGELINCIGTSYCFASSFSAVGGDISGILRDCKSDDVSFASSQSAAGGNISGSMYNCSVINSGGGFANGADVGGTISGKLYDCRTVAAGFCSGGGNISGDLYNCFGGAASFAAGVSAIAAGTISGRLFDCVASSGSFASSVSGASGTISGQLRSCIGTSNCFASRSSGQGGTISGEMYTCKATTGSFASGSTTGGTISGKLVGCIGTSTTFASATTTGGTISGQLIDCTGTTICFASASTTGGSITSTAVLVDIKMNTGANWNATNVGVLRNSRINGTGNSQGAAVKVGAGARIEYCTLKGTNAVTAASAISADITFCKLIPTVTGAGLHSNVTNLTTTPYNTDESTSTF